MEQATELGDVVKEAKPMQFTIAAIQLNAECKSLAEREVVEGLGKICRAGQECSCAGYFGNDEKGPVYLCLYDGLKRE